MEKTPFSLWCRWWYPWAEKRAWRNEEWAAIERLRQDPTHPSTSIWIDEDRGLTWEVWERQSKMWNAIQDRTLDGKLDRIIKRTHWWLDKHGLRAQYHHAKAFWQRGQRGYSNADTWNLDSYLAQVIADSLTYFRLHSHSHPSDMSAEMWDAILTEMVEGFRAHDDEDKTQFNEGMRLFVEHFESLWD